MSNKFQNKERKEEVFAETSGGSCYNCGESGNLARKGLKLILRVYV